MYVKLITNKVFAYWAVMLLVLASGNSVFKVYGTYFYVLVGILVLFEFARSRSLRMRYRRLWQYVAIMLSIFGAQYLTFGWNSFPGIVNFISKILFGSFIIIALDFRFKYYYLRVMYHLAVISLIFFFLQTLFNVTFSLIDVGKVGKSILFYFSHNRAFDRNCGAFWEPGAYGCYLMFVPLLFMGHLTYLFRTYKRECIVLLIALLTTQSTTAYLALAALVFIYFMLQMKSRFKYVLILLGVILATYIYSNVEFLQEKIEGQNEQAIAANGKFNATRVGTFLFDMQYFQKHPLTGNGLHSRTRYADHPYLVKMWSDGEMAKGGNAFSDYLAKMGIVFYLAIIYFFYKTNKGIRKIDILSFFVILVMLLFGEPLFSYPIALSLPFINLKINEYEKFSSNTNCVQPKRENS